MALEGAVDAHVHAYPIAAWGRRRLADHAITEYGAGVPLGTANAVGDLGSVQLATSGCGITDVVAFDLYEPARVADDVRDLRDAGIRDPIEGPGDYVAWLNRWLCAEAYERPWLHAVVAADPMAMPGSGMIEHLDVCIEMGAVGVKLHHAFAGMSPNDPLLWPLYRECAVQDLPVVCHSGRSVPLAGFGDVLDRFPGIRLILAHAGGSGWRETPAFARRYPGVAFDVAELLWWVGAPGAPGPAEMRDLIHDIGVERMMFGSDFPWYEPAPGLALLRGLGLAEVAITTMTCHTARRWFGLMSAKGPVPHEASDRHQLGG